MKQTRLLTALLLLFVISADAQNKSTQKKELLSYNLSLSDYESTGAINGSSVGNNWYKAGRMSFGFGVSYWRGLTDKIDASGSLTGTFSNFPANFVKNDSIGQAGFSSQLDALVHLRAFKETAPVNPFLTTGLGFGYFPKKVAAYAPMGVGLQFRFKQGTYLFTQAQWRLKITSGISNDYLHYSIGFAQNNPFKRMKKPAEYPVEIPVEPVLPPDGDGDGFADANDKCPDVKGTINGCPDSDADGVADKDDACPAEKGTLNGCPDTDADGVADKDDQCPTEKGSLNGCPDSDNDGVADKVDQCPAEKGTLNGCPDSDGDGVADKDDACPTEKGIVNGCPDKDNDGVADKDDKCPDEAGVHASQGCPEIKQEVKQQIAFAAKNIQFQFGSYRILSKSYKSLDAVLLVLQENPLLKLNIAAHADNAGVPEQNLKLSEKRAKAVADYFISKGIDANRITAKGYGDTQPIADNRTAKGKSINRRVEMKVEY